MGLPIDYHIYGIFFLLQSKDII